MIRAVLDAVMVDVGGTLVQEAAPGTSVSDLVVNPLPTVKEDLARIAAEVPIIAVTNTSMMLEADVLGLLGQAGLAQYMVGAVTSAEVGKAKPDPAPVRVALERLGEAGQSPDRVLFIGDLPTDEAAARGAGVHYANVTDRGVLDTVVRWIEARAGSTFRRAASAVTPPDAVASQAAGDLHLNLTKPAGSLGRLEVLGARLAGVAGTCPPPLPLPCALAVFAGDHGVVDEGVTPWPQAVTGQMVANLASGGAAASVLARQLGVELHIVDVGVAGPPVVGSSPRGVLCRRVASGSANLALGPAMTTVQAAVALDVGVEVAHRLIDDGAACLLTGDMGIGNTTPSAALISSITGLPADQVTGRGTGIDDTRLRLKIQVVRDAVSRSAGRDSVELLADIGGLEIAALAGFIVGGAAGRVPVILDGVITVAAALMAEMLVPGVAAYCIASHRSVEPGATAGLDHLGLDPLMDLGLRLGEGTGALMALPLVEAAARLLGEMATFESAGVSQTPSAG